MEIHLCVINLSRLIREDQPAFYIVPFGCSFGCSFGCENKKIRVAQ